MHHLFTTKEAADLIGYSPETLRHWRMGRKIWEPGLGPRFSCVNGRIFYSSAALDLWLRTYVDSDGLNRTQPAESMAEF